MSLRGLFETIYLASAILLAAKQEPPFGARVTLPAQSQQTLPSEVREALAILHGQRDTGHQGDDAHGDQLARFGELPTAPMCSAETRAGASSSGSVMVAAVAVDAVGMAVR